MRSSWRYLIRTRCRKVPRLRYAFVRSMDLARRSGAFRTCPEATGLGRLEPRDGAAEREAVAVVLGRDAGLPEKGAP